MNSLKELHDKLAAENKEKRKWAVEAATDDYREQFNAMADAYSISCFYAYSLTIHVEALLRQAQERLKAAEAGNLLDTFTYEAGKIDAYKEILGYVD